MSRRGVSVSVSLAAAALLLAGCGGSAGQATSAGSTSTSSGGATTTSASSGAGSGGGMPDGPYTPEHVWTECQASDQAWIRRAILAVDGRRPAGQAEINALEDVIKGIRKADRIAAGKYGDLGSTLPPEWDDLVNARKLVATSLMQESGFRLRWSDVVMDALRVVRIETKSQESCYGNPSPNPIDGGQLAAWVRDNDPASGSAPLPAFSMGQLLSSALALDDLSVVYRAHLFAMLNHPIDGANVDFTAMERIRRRDFGAVFDNAYVHRDTVCMSCHNSEFSVTFNADPSKNRAWPVPGLFELSLYGASDGKHPAGEAMTKGADDMRAFSVLRVADVVGNGTAPFGWLDQCGTFTVPKNDDPLAIDAYFGSIRSTAQNPGRGLRASVWDVERSLHRGVDLLAAHGLRRLAGGKLADEDEAFAYLVAENIVEQVWAEIVGTRLTIANYFPRTQVQRDILMSLTEHFVATHFSLKALILDILAHPAFNLKSPAEGCGNAAYELPTILDPWTTSEADLSRRGNSPADGVFAIASRPLVRSLHGAMEWPGIEQYPSNDASLAFQVAIGVFIKDAEPGYRGLDFQGRLTWESVYGKCQNPVATDFITKIVDRASAVAGATLGDGVIALKDRLVGEPWIEPATEQPAIEALLAAPLATVDVGTLDAHLRAMCGVLVSTPQFMLGGMVPRDTRDVPKIAPLDVTYATTCTGLAGFMAGTSTPYLVTCGDGSLTVGKK